MGPTWKGLWGSKVSLKGGGTAAVDAEYVRTSVRTPGDARREDAMGTMPAYGEDRISDTELDSVVKFIEELGEPST